MDLKKAVSFIKYHKKCGNRVYVHCRAGHGRSAAVIFAWLMYNYPNADPLELNMHLCRLRKVRKTLWKQPNINRYRNWLKAKRPIPSEDSWLPMKKISNEERIRPERKVDLRPDYGQSGKGSDSGDESNWQQLMDEDSKSASIGTSAKRKVNDFWRSVFGFDDVHVIDSDGEMSSADFSDSEVNMDYVN